MRKRADQVEAIRQRIVEAAVRLHTTVGPARTTISGIAQEADVTRLTVYRHFPDEQTLLSAFSEQWERDHPAPDPDTWRAIPDLETRAQHALRELHAWYDEHGEDLLPIYRDLHTMPAEVLEGERAQQQLVDALIAGTGERGRARRRLRAAAGHAVSFWTWHSLCVEQELHHAEGADLAACLLIHASKP